MRGLLSYLFLRAGVLGGISVEGGHIREQRAGQEVFAFVVLARNFVHADCPRFGFALHVVEDIGEGFHEGRAAGNELVETLVPQDVLGVALVALAVAVLNADFSVANGADNKLAIDGAGNFVQLDSVGEVFQHDFLAGGQIGRRIDDDCIVSVHGLVSFTALVVDGVDGFGIARANQLGGGDEVGLLDAVQIVLGVGAYHLHGGFALADGLGGDPENVLVGLDGAGAGNGDLFGFQGGQVEDENTRFHGLDGSGEILGTCHFVCLLC